MQALAALPLTLALLIGPARNSVAGGLDFDLLGARSIGRAGATTVSGDGGLALVINPAGLARSTSLRVQLGASLHDDDASYRAPEADAPASPTVADRSAPVVIPSGAVQGALGPVVLGAGVLVLGRLDRSLPAPVFNQADQDPEEVDELFPHRYGGLQLSYRRRVLVAGAAMRIGEWLGVGASLGASDVELGERRHIWAGFDGRDRLAFPVRDLDLTMEAGDSLVPFAAAGMLVAPPALPIELGLSLAWSDDARLDGDAALGRTLDRPYPEPRSDGSSSARLRLAMPSTLRAGARYLGDRFLVELGAELTWFGDDGKVPAWRTGGVGVRDDTGQEELLDQMPSLVALRNHAAARAAVDVEVVSGLLWLTAGYARSSAATARSRLTAAFGDIPAHTVSLGAEGTWNQISFALGVARRMSPTVYVTDDDSSVELVNPFGAAAGTADAGAGRHGRAHDAVGLTMEIGWE